MSTPELHIDIAIIGGGIAGLWSLNQLRNAGYSAVLFEQGDGLSGWRDVISEFDAYFYWRPPAASAHTLFARVTAAAGWSMTMPFQLTLGWPKRRPSRHDPTGSGEEPSSDTP